jgi:hypothetical protein
MGVLELPREPSPRRPDGRWRRWRADVLHGLVLMGAAMAGLPTEPRQATEPARDDGKRRRPE